jgi:hypothetical protein
MRMMKKFLFFDFWFSAGQPQTGRPAQNSKTQN